MKATEQYFPLELYSGVLTFHLTRETLNGDKQTVTKQYFTFLFFLSSNIQSMLATVNNSSLNSPDFIFDGLLGVAKMLQITSGIYNFRGVPRLHVVNQIRNVWFLSH